MDSTMMTRFLDRIAQTHRCTPDQARAILIDGLAALHEVSYKHGSSAGLRLAHDELGSLATWHVAGLLVDAAEDGNPGGLVRALLQVDPATSQHDAVAEQWDREKGLQGQQAQQQQQ
jgi:hypothetical protein